MITLILIFIFELVFFLLGYYLGRLTNKPPIELKQGLKKFYVNGKEVLMPTPTIPTGMIKPKTEQEKAFDKLPDKVKEGIGAMRETLNNDPSMVQHKKLVEEFKKSGQL